MDKQFKKGCVFIIGGSGGIGRACVQRFAEAGAKIVFTYHQNIQATAMGCCCLGGEEGPTGVDEMAGCCWTSSVDVVTDEF